MVSFGFAPGAIMYIVLNDLLLAQQLPSFWAYTAFIIPVFSALRLAKFNNDTRQSTYFVGLPTPANTLFFMSIPFVLAHSAISNTFVNSPAFLISLILLMSFFMIAEIPLISLKFKNFDWNQNLEKYLLIGISIILFVILKFVAIPLIIICYLLLSIVSKKKIIS
jgi:CDP-diacylglycerol--serine O-phosphatidyltransferase